MGDKMPGFQPEGLGVEGKDLKAGKLYVEVGSGGSPAFFVSGRSLNPEDRYVTVDFVEEEVRNSKMFGEINFGDSFQAIRGDGRKLPLKDESVDEVIFNNVFGDRRTMGRNQMLSEAVRVLKTGGRVILTEHITPVDFIRELGGTEDEIIQYLQKHNINLTVKKVSTEESDAEGYIGKKDSRFLKGAPLQVILEK